MASEALPDLQYPGGVSGTHKPAEQTPQAWVSDHFAKQGRLVALAVVRAGARHYSLIPTMQATGIAYVAWASSDRVTVDIYPFHEAREANDDGHNFFWQYLSEDDNPAAFDSCPQEVLMALTPAPNAEAYMWRRECARAYPQHVFPQLYEHLQLVYPQEGERWRLRVPVERFPHFIAEAGQAGVIDESGAHLICLKLDDPLPGAETWDNSVCWNPDDTNGAVLWEFLLECERAGETTR